MREPGHIPTRLSALDVYTSDAVDEQELDRAGDLRRCLFERHHERIDHVRNAGTARG